jgi:ribonuclease HI
MGELMAVLDLLRQTADRPDDLKVFCDSRYVIDAVTKWTPGWKARGWRKADGKPVLNVDLIQPIDDLLAQRRRSNRRVEFVWVKGHAGHRLNEAADRLANGAATAYQAGTVPDPGPGYAVSRPVAGETPTGPGPSADRPEHAADLFSVTADAGSAPTKRAGDDLESVIELERSLLTGAIRTSPRALDALLHPDWSEIGASGRLLDRRTTVERLGPIPATMEMIDATRLSQDVILLVWRAITPERATLRSSVWVRDEGRWRQRFHQGTVQS